MSSKEETVQELGFEAEVQQLLDLMIHSVYSDREVFLRELISNAADALDKVRFMGLTRNDLVAAEGEASIRIQVDGDAGTLTIEDDGIGMTREEVVSNLGTIARSGSREFLDKAGKEGDGLSLIGQFGIGFYASFMVASDVEVLTRSALPDEPAVRWTSSGAGTYRIEEADKAHRGTRITLTLRDDAREFADEARLKDVVRRHSNFLPWPIQVAGEQANSAKALWTEPPSQVTDEELNEFYKSIALDWQEPAFHVHISVDSPIQIRALLFIPQQQPFDLYNPRAQRGPRLYSSRVLITEHAEDVLPEWLRFVRGVVDSEDIPLNVSREMVQKAPVVRKIRDNLVKRLLKDLGRIADPPEGKVPKADYGAIWKSFGPLLKEGYYSSPEWRDALRPLLRFNAISHDDADGLLSLEEYRGAMPEGQDAIWFLAAETREDALASPHLEAFRKRGWDVLVLTDPVDEWLVTVLEAYEGLPLKSVARGELSLDDDDDKPEANLDGLLPWMEKVYDGAVTKVRPSSRLTDSACVLVDDESGISANMERILRAANQDGPSARRILELNPKHPLVRNLAELQERGLTDQAEPLARLLLDDARLLDGTLEEPTAVGRRLQDVLVLASSAALEGKGVDATAPKASDQEPA